MTAAYSEVTGKHYPTFEALVEEEANGWLATAVLTRGDETWPWSVGPFSGKREALRAAARMRRKIRAETSSATTFSVFVRPAWKGLR